MAYERFMWQKGDVEIVNESDFKNNAKLYDSKNDNPYECCELISVCLECDEEEQKVAVVIAQKVYDSFFSTSLSDETLFQKVLKSFVNLCNKILPENIVLTKQLYCCAKMKLLDMLIINGKYTKEQIKEIL